MKKIIILSTIFLIAITAQSQKIYSTKTGQIKFKASSSIEKIEAVNNQTDSKFVDKTGQIVFSVLIKGFKFENELMEDHFNENYMESTKFPKADFKGFITNISSVNFSQNGKYPVTAEGDLTIHGVTKKVSVSGTMTITAGKPTLTGVTKVQVSDFGITGLYIGTKIAREAEITVSCDYN
jgi:hypothetical protein